MAMDRRRFLQAAGVGAGLGMTGAGWAFHDGVLLQPSYGEIEGLRILGYSDMGFGDDGSDIDPVSGLPWDRTAEIRVVDGYAYCSNYQGFSIVAVQDPTNMQVVFRHQNALGQNTQYIDIKGGNILVVKETTQLRLWDVTHKSAPVELSTFAPPDIAGGFHGLWVHEDHRGRFAFSPCRVSGYAGDILLIIDITNPLQPTEVSRWWYPGQKAGETPTWPATGFTVQAHDTTTYKDRAYAAWRDKGLIILDISNIASPTKVGEINWSDGRPNFPSLPGQTHAFGVVLPNHDGRAETLVSTDELSQCPYGYAHILDIRNELDPREISEFKLPLNLHGNCPPDRPGRRFGIHDVERAIRGKIAWSAWEEAGFWGIDISDLHNPKSAGYYVPPVRSDSPPTSRSGHADDAFVTRNGIIFGSSSDPGAGGLWAMRHVPGFKGTVAWNADESDVIVTRARGSGN